MIRKTSIQDLIRWLIYALIVGVPSVYYTGFDSVFTMPKLTVMRLITLLIVAVWGLQIFAQGELRYRRSPLLKWFLALGVVSGLTTLFSTYFWVSFFGGQGLFNGFLTTLNLIFLAVTVLFFFQDKRNLYRTLKISVITAVVLSVYGLLQFKGWVGAEGWDQDPTLRVFGTMGHSNHFGGYLAFHVLLLAGLWVNARRASEKIVWSLAALPMLATILATASRGAVGALVISGAVFVTGLAVHHRGWIRAERKKLLVGALIVLALAGVFHRPLINRFTHLSLTQRTLDTVQFIREGNVPDRVSWWFSAFAMVRDHPVLGHGLATFRDVYNSYRRLDYRVPGDIQDTFSPETAHMEYFNRAATEGLLGLAVYLSLILCWALLLLRVMRDPETSTSLKITALSLLAAGIGYFVQASMSFGVVGTLVPLYVLLGVSGALYHMTADPTPQSKQFRSIRLVRGEKLMFVIVVLTVYVFSAWFTFRQASAEAHLQKGDDARRDGEVAVMLEHYQAATQAMPWMYEYWQRYGEGAYQFGAMDNEFQIMETLLRTSIDAYNQAYRRMRTMPAIQANLGLANLVYAQVLDAQGKTAKAKDARERGIELYREAIDVGVNNPLFSYNYGRLLYSVQRLNEARDAFLYVLEIRTPYKDTFYQLALVETDQKNYEKARHYIQQALRTDSRNDNVKILQQRINAEASRANARP